MSKTLGNILKYTLSFALAIFLLWLVVRKIEWTSFIEGLKTTDWKWMIGYVLASVLALVFRSLRWKQLLKPLDSRIRYGFCWDANNIGNLGSLVIPGSCEPIRAGIICSKKIPLQTVFGTIIMERAWDCLFIFLTFVLAVLFKLRVFGDFIKENVLGAIGSTPVFWWIIVACILLFSTALWCIYHFRNKIGLFSKFADIIDGLLKGLGSFTKIKNKLLYIIYSTMIWVMYMLMTYFCLKAVPELSGLDLADALFISTLGNIASIIPTPGGIGAYHYLLILCVTGIYGVGNETGLLFAMLNHEGHAIVVFVLGLCSYLVRMIVMKEK